MKEGYVVIVIVTRIADLLIYRPQILVIIIIVIITIIITIIIIIY